MQKALMAVVAAIAIPVVGILAVASMGLGGMHNSGMMAGCDMSHMQGSMMDGKMDSEQCRRMMVDMSRDECYAMMPKDHVMDREQCRRMMEPAPSLP